MYRILLFCLILCVLLATPHSLHAQGTSGGVLFVAPHRLIMPPNEKVGVLSLVNRSKDTKRYDLSIVDQVMDENGVTQRRDTFPYSAKSMVKFVPRRFTLKPGERQTVRVMITRPEGLADGDYHSHLMFREVPLNVKDKEQLKSERKEDEKTVSFEIKTLYGIGVPIVVQQGTLTENLVLGELALDRDQNGIFRLKAEFLREGNTESVGRMKVEYVPASGEAVSVTEPQWVRVYRETPKITRLFPLEKMSKDMTGGKLVVSLSKTEAADSPTVTKEIPLQ